MNHDIPRRVDRSRHTPAEVAITEAMAAVEAAGADARLTDAIVLLTEARDAVAEFVDNEPRGKWNNRVPSLKLELEEVRADRNRVGMEVRREWMGKTEALAKERDALRAVGIAGAEYIMALETFRDGSRRHSEARAVYEAAHSALAIVIAIVNEQK